MNDYGRLGGGGNEKCMDGVGVLKPISFNLETGIN